MHTMHRRSAWLLLAAVGTLLVGCGESETIGSNPDEPAASTEPTDTSAAPDITGTPTPSGLADPLPDVDQPGLVTCAGCVEVSGVTDFEPDVADETTLTVTGTVTGAEGPGAFYVEDATGQSVGGPVPVDPGGGFAVTVPVLCGEQLVKVAWPSDAGAAGVVLRPTGASCTTASLRVTLTWDDLGDDFELHLVREGGTINDSTDDGSISNDCTWTTCIGESPDWGVIGSPDDDPVKDIDDTGSFGPENITLAQPEPITYTVLVEHWGNGDPGADGEVIVNIEGRDVQAFPITDLAPEWVAIVATIELPSGTITPVGEQYDCSTEWSGGCTAAIPA